MFDIKKGESVMEEKKIDFLELMKQLNLSRKNRFNCNNPENILVLVYSPNNKKTPRIKKVFSRAYSTVKYRTDIDFFLVNSDENKEIIKKFKIKRNPTIIFFRGGEEEKRKGFILEKELHDEVMLTLF